MGAIQRSPFFSSFPRTPARTTVPSSSSTTYDI
jgi:hypothetical protein